MKVTLFTVVAVTGTDVHVTSFLTRAEAAACFREVMTDAFGEDTLTDRALSQESYIGTDYRVQLVETDLCNPSVPVLLAIKQIVHDRTGR